MLDWPILSEVAGSDVLQAAHALMIENGAWGPIRWLHEEKGEWTFIVDTHGAANMNEEGATRALTKLLGGKVWIATDGLSWVGRGTPL
jgi:hypothetical protein